MSSHSYTQSLNSNNKKKVIFANYTPNGCVFLPLGVVFLLFF